jgi:hypothetical protein
MGLDLWFRQDVARILASTWQTMHACVSAAATAQATGPATRPGMGDEGRPGAVATSDERIVGAYRRGFEDALRAVGVAFGLAEGSNGGRHGGYPPEYPGSWGED